MATVYIPENGRLAPRTTLVAGEYGHLLDRGLGEWFPGAVQERLPGPEQPTRRMKALPGAKYSPDEVAHFPDQSADHDTEGRRAGCQTAHAARAWLRRLRG
ncbi:hypothetical protein TNCT6_55730 [Streptomyces sp. 6-11-2]|nr:hypothetical protein TNCT6_55730 [Streptomyces sp. 6-11-2]